MTLYKALILPPSEHCCQLWSSKEFIEIGKLEAVQQTFTYRIEEISYYWECLSELGLKKYRREKHDYGYMEDQSGLSTNYRIEWCWSVGCA